LLTLKPDWSWGGSSPAMAPHCISSGRSSGLPRSWIALERLVGVDEDAGLPAQVFDPGIGSGDAVLQTRDQVWYRCVELDGLELVFGLGPELVEGGNGEECTGAAGQDQGIWALEPGTTWHRRHQSLSALVKRLAALGLITTRGPAWHHPGLLQTRLTRALCRARIRGRWAVLLNSRGIRLAPCG